MERTCTGTSIGTGKTLDCSALHPHHSNAPNTTPPPPPGPGEGEVGMTMAGGVCVRARATRRRKECHVATGRDGSEWIAVLLGWVELFLGIRPEGGGSRRWG
eukprot:CAMPEP_0119362452 /NCGR_PEP_ID=MMETSP1334-20130426/9515_1 /TAXON_ID=127549 /ORGANISM="Calcidiscus leptoporus, Strain RCC1130" /LENGTH=101 /DNA_ID=CAMNT_0007377671 /DNA_START=157 /DNA_END=462 /DNA_ORIENTATION=+